MKQVTPIEITWGPNQQLLTLLAASKARVLVMGGTAVRFHAPDRRPPNDLDLLMEASRGTAQKVLDALDSVLGRRSPITADQLARPSTGFAEKRVLNIDIMTPHRGFGFAKHWALAEKVTMNDSATPVRVASIPTLLVWLKHAMTVEPKRASDILRDVGILEAVAHQGLRR